MKQRHPMSETIRGEGAPAFRPTTRRVASIERARARRQARSENRRRKTMLMVRITEEEQRKIRGDAAHSGLTMSSYVRARLGL